MLKRIFLPLENSPYTLAAIKYACFISKRLNAKVTAGIFLDVEKRNKSLGILKTDTHIEWAKDVNKEVISEAEDTVKFLISTLRKNCAKNEVKFSIEKEIVQPSKNIYDLSKYYDLIITGLKSDFRLFKKGFTSEYLKKMLSYSVTPVFAVLDHFWAVKNIIIAYDGSNSAARALQRFSHIANFRGHKIRLLMSSNNNILAEGNIKKAKEYLMAYGAKNFISEWTKKDILKLARSKYFDSADLIVLGLHSKRNIRDFFVGSVTESLIEEAQKPLFIGI